MEPKGQKIGAMATVMKCSKFDRNQAIHDMKESGVTYEKVAAEFKISTSRAKQIVGRVKLWKKRGVAYR